MLLNKTLEVASNTIINRSFTDSSYFNFGLKTGTIIKYYNTNTRVVI